MRYNGATWERAKLNVYTGGSFQNKALKYWDGGNWVSVDITG
jgi:hypothetical protein